MFTGIVEEVGRVLAVEPAGLQVGCAEVLGDLAPGDSVAVAGCCLTVTRVEADRLAFDLMGETLARTTLGRLEVGDAVNLERAVPADGRLGGHVVQGHVDGVGTVAEVVDHPGWRRVALEVPAGLRRYLAAQGSVAVEGVSLTVAEVTDLGAAVGLVPHTLEVTTLGALRPGDPVNLEADVLAKHVERLLAARRAEPVTEEQR